MTALIVNDSLWTLYSPNIVPHPFKQALVKLQIERIAAYIRKRESEIIQA